LIKSSEEGDEKAEKNDTKVKEVISDLEKTVDGLYAKFQYLFRLSKFPGNTDDKL